MKRDIAKDIEIAFFIDRVMARAYPKGAPPRREKIVEQLRKYIAEDEKLPTLKEAVSFVKNTK